MRRSLRLLPLLVLLALAACRVPSDFTYTGLALAAMPEAQLVPTGVMPIEQFASDGGQGMAARTMAYAGRWLGTDRPETEIAAYYGRELPARGWQRCTPLNSHRYATQWCKGVLIFWYDTAPILTAGNPWQQQHKMIYEIRLVEYRP